MFWNMDDYPISVDTTDDLDPVFGDISKALDLMGFRLGFMDVRLYSEQHNYDKKSADIIRPSLPTCKLLTTTLLSFACLFYFNYYYVIGVVSLLFIRSVLFGLCLQSAGYHFAYDSSRIIYWTRTSEFFCNRKTTKGVTQGSAVFEIEASQCSSSKATAA